MLVEGLLKLPLLLCGQHMVAAISRHTAQKYSKSTKETCRKPAAAEHMIWTARVEDSAFNMLRQLGGPWETAGRSRAAGLRC